MKQYKITSANILQDSQEDCYLDPNDPIHELKIANHMGGLGSTAKLEAYRIQATMDKIKNEQLSSLPRGRWK
jgi:hypothetical protein